MKNNSASLSPALIDRYLPRVAIINSKCEILESSSNFQAWFGRKVFSARELIFLTNLIQNNKFGKDFVLESDNESFIVCLEQEKNDRYYLEIKEEIKKGSILFGRKVEITLWNFLSEGPLYLWACNEHLDFEFFGKNWSKRGGGIDLDEIEQNWMSFIHPEDVDDFLPAFMNAVQHKAIFNLEYRIKSSEGDYFWIMNQAFPYYEEGTFKGYIGFNYDIQKRKEIEEALELNRERLEMAVETGELGTWEWEIETGKCYFNDKWFQMLGYEVGEVSSDYQSFVAKIHPEDINTLHEALMDHSINKTDFFEADIRIKGKDGKYKWIYDRGKTVEYSASGVAKRIIGIHIDITNMVETRRSLSQKLKELDEKNIELQRYIDSNLELENFAYIASHDMKEPLRNITSFAQLLSRDLQKQKVDNAHEYINFIITGAKNMNALIEDLLEFSKVNTQALKMDEFDPIIAVEAIKSDLHHFLKESKTQISCTDFPKTILADKIKFKQVLFNLINNGIKFQKEGSIPLIEISCKEKREAWEFSVQDNGIGIEEKFFEKIFLLFKRLHAKESFAGTGMGLAICKKIVERHGGEISLKSKLGEGTIFSFSIPKEQDGE